MKLTKLLSILVIAVVAFSCSKNDDNKSEPPYSLTRTNFVDTYSMNFLELKVVETVVFNNGSTSTSSSTTVGSVFTNVNYVFKADGTFIASGLYNAVETILNPDGTTVTNDPIIVSLDKTGTYSLNPASKIVAMTDQEGNEVVFDIELYSETEMRLISETEVTSGNSTIVSRDELRFSR